MQNSRCSRGIVHVYEKNVGLRNSFTAFYYCILVVVSQTTRCWQASLWRADRLATNLCDSRAVWWSIHWRRMGSQLQHQIIVTPNDANRCHRPRLVYLQASVSAACCETAAGHISSLWSGVRAYEVMTSQLLTRHSCSITAKSFINSVYFKTAKYNSNQRLMNVL